MILKLKSKLKTSTKIILSKKIFFMVCLVIHAGQFKYVLTIGVMSTKCKLNVIKIRSMKILKITLVLKCV